MPSWKMATLTVTTNPTPDLVSGEYVALTLKSATLRIDQSEPTLNLRPVRGVLLACRRDKRKANLHDGQTRPKYGPYAVRKLLWE